MINHLDLLKKELMSILQMMDTASPQVLMASMRLNTVLAAAAYDEQAAHGAQADAQAEAEAGVKLHETEEEKELRINTARRLAEAAEEDYQIAEKQKEQLLAQAREVGLTQEQLEAFDIVTKMAQLDRNIKMAYVKGAEWAGISKKAGEDSIIAAANQLAAEDLVPFWLQLGQICLRESNFDEQQLTKLRSLISNFIKYSVIGTHGELVLSRLEDILSSPVNTVGNSQHPDVEDELFGILPQSTPQRVMEALRESPLENEQKPSLLFENVAAIEENVERLEQRWLAQEGQALIEELLKCYKEGKPFLKAVNLLRICEIIQDISTDETIFNYLPPLKLDDRRLAILILNDIAQRLVVPGSERKWILTFREGMQKQQEEAKETLYKNIDALCTSIREIGFDKNEEGNKIAAQLDRSLKKLVNQFFDNHNSGSLEKLNKEMIKVMKKADKQIATLAAKEIIQPIRFKSFRNALRWMLLTIKGGDLNDLRFQKEKPAIVRYSLFATNIQNNLQQTSVPALNPPKSANRR